MSRLIEIIVFKARNGQCLYKASDSLAEVKTSPSIITESAQNFSSIASLFSNNMFFSKITLLGCVATAAYAYQNNCDGSSFQPTISDCRAGLDTINTGITYQDQSQFSSGDCYIIYATNGAGVEPVTGQLILDTANAILDNCNGHGSYGTNNNGCSACHVTINYRSPP